MNSGTLDSALEFPLRGSALIEASAGTGKTFTIAGLYLRLVLGHGGDDGFGRALSPPEILVVTFTNAATEELRERIRDRLAEAARHFRGETDGDGLLRALRGEYAAERHEHCARLLELAAAWMDESAIHTIHSFAQRMLREHAFDSGSPFELTLDEEQERRLEEVARDYWRTFVFTLDETRYDGVRQHFAGPDQLLATVRNLFGKTLSISGDGAFDTLDRQAAMAGEVRKTLAASFDEVAATLSRSLERGDFKANKINAQKLEDWLDDLRQWSAAGISLRPDDDRIGKYLTRSGLRESMKKGCVAPEHRAFELLQALYDACNSDLMKAKLTAHARDWIEQRFAREKRRAAALGFDDLLTGLDGALASESGVRLAATIRRRFPVAMIDEFQDTDPVQYRIFRQVYLNRDDCVLFLIGDPKQAIYRFRGADIFTYIAARRDTEGRHFTLGRNYRSTGMLVAAVNGFFSHAERYPKGAFLFRPDIGFGEVAAQGRGDRLVVDGGEVAPMTIWHSGDGGIVNKANYQDDFAAITATQIVQLLNAGTEGRAGFDGADGFRPLQPGDIAILVRNRKEAAVIRRELAVRGVRSVYLSDRDSVFATPEASDVLRILGACAEAENERALRAGLATALLARPVGWLDILNRDEDVFEAMVEQFRRYRAAWRRQGVLPMLRRVLQDFDVGAQLLAAGDERTLTNVLHLAELLQAAADSVDGEIGLMRWLSERIDAGESGRSRDEEILRLESDSALVRVVTIHKSKGLEYPLVFMPFVCNTRVEKKGAILEYHDDAGELVADLAPDDDAIERANQERLAEELRLLYVALTRARYACWLGVAPLRGGNAGGKSRTTDLHHSGIGYVLAGGASIDAGELGELLRGLVGDGPIAISAPPAVDDVLFTEPVTASTPTAARVFGRCLPPPWSVTSYSALMGHLAAVTVPALAADTPAEELLREESVAAAPARVGVAPGAGPVDTVHGFPAGPGPGTFLHGMLESAAAEGFRKLVDDTDFRREWLERRCRRGGFERFAAVLDVWLVQLLTRPLALPDGSAAALADLAGSRAELEFWFPARDSDFARLDALARQLDVGAGPRPRLEGGVLNGMLKGFIDLVFIHDERYYVLDYKSNYLGADAAAYSRESIGRSMREHRYDLQASIYLLAAHRLLAARLGDGYDPATHLGGAVYYYLRGVDADTCGVWGSGVDAAWLAQLDRLFAEGGDR